MKYTVSPKRRCIEIEPVPAEGIREKIELVEAIDKTVDFEFWSGVLIGLKAALGDLILPNDDSYDIYR
jgi:hypothetical protein